jgi:hypothetical protein
MLTGVMAGIVSFFKDLEKSKVSASLSQVSELLPQLARDVGGEFIDVVVVPCAGKVGQGVDQGHI